MAARRAEGKKGVSYRHIGAGSSVGEGTPGNGLLHSATLLDVLRIEGQSC